MTGFEAYRLCHSLKLHFNTDSYDYFKYNGKTNVSQKSYRKRREFPTIYESLSSRYKDDKLMEYFVANIVDGDPNAGIYGNEGDEKYLKWKRNIQNITYTFSQQIEDLLEKVNHFDDLFKVVGGNNPVLLQHYYWGDVSIETFIIMNKVLNFFPQFSRELDDEYRWPNVKRRCEKYAKFLDIDIQKYIEILKNKLDIQ